jgi:hypothetical protein
MLTVKTKKTGRFFWFIFVPGPALFCYEKSMLFTVLFSIGADMPVTFFYDDGLFQTTESHPVPVSIHQRNLTFPEPQVILYILLHCHPGMFPLENS